MDIKVFPALIVGVVVALVLAGATLPIWADTLAKEDTFNNTGYYDLVTYTETDNVTFTWLYTNPMVITINGEDIDLPDIVNGTPRTILCGDDWCIRWIKLNSGYYGLDYIASNATAGASQAGGGTSMTVVCEGGEMTLTTTASVTRTNTYTSLYCIAKDGPFIMKDSNKPAYVLGDSPIYAMGTSINVWSGTNVYIKISGTIDDGITASVFGYYGDDPVTVVDTNVNYSPVSGHDDLYTISDIVITVNNGDSDKTITYSYYIVPDSVTADRSVYMDGPLSAIVAILPLLIVAGLVTGAVVWFINRKG